MFIFLFLSVIDHLIELYLVFFFHTGDMVSVCNEIYVKEELSCSSLETNQVCSVFFHALGTLIHLNRVHAEWLKANIIMSTQYFGSSFKRSPQYVGSTFKKKGRAFENQTRTSPKKKSRYSTAIVHGTQKKFNWYSIRTKKKIVSGYSIIIMHEI